MRTFFKFMFASCLGTLLAVIFGILILILIGSSMTMSNFDQGKSVHVTNNTVLKINIPANLPEQTNNVPMQSFSFDDKKVLGVHDYAHTIRQAITDPNIKGIYLMSNINNHGYATLKIIRDALVAFQQSGKFIISYSNYIDHKNYFLLSTADKIYLHPLGFLDLKGFGATIPFYKDMLDKIGVKFNIYYAGEFKSATEPFRLNKMSPENRLQLSEYLNEQFDLYTQQVAISRHIDYQVLKNNFNQFLSYSPQKAYDNKLVDSLAYEIDVINYMSNKMGLNNDDKINYITPEDYYSTTGGPKKDYTAKNKVAVIYAEGNITDGQGEEGVIGRKYLKIIRDIRANKSIKAIVLRVNSPGGSALMSDDILKELDLAKAEGKPVVVSMGDYAASGGYYISCHADSIFASQHTLTGSIGVFAMIPNFNNLLEDKFGIDFDTVGTGPKSNMFSVATDWGAEEARVLQENVDHTYDAFLKVVSSGRNMSKEDVHKIARGRIWNGIKAKELGLVNEIGELEDAIACAARLASLDKYRTTEFPSQLEGIQKIIQKFKGDEDEIQSSISNSIIKEQLGSYYPYYKSMQDIKSYKGLQMRLPVMIHY